MKVSFSAFYAASKKTWNAISPKQMQLKARIETLFEEKNKRIGSRQMLGILKSEGFKIGRYKVSKLMKQLGLYCLQRKAKPKSKKGQSDRIKPNLLNQNFNPLFANEVWAGDITYLKTIHGWRYLAVVMDLYSRRIIAWVLSNHMRASLAVDALQKAHTLRRPQHGCVFHSDRGAQYTSDAFQDKAEQLNMRSSMGDVGCCFDNAVVERFFGSLKHEGLGPTRMMTETQLQTHIANYIRYYNMTRLHSRNDGMSPFTFESSQIKVCGIA
jgi:putative transposase